MSIEVQMLLKAACVMRNYSSLSSHFISWNEPIMFGMYFNVSFIYKSITVNVRKETPLPAIRIPSPLQGTYSGACRGRGMVVSHPQSS